MFLKPLIGLIFLKSGLIAVIEGLNETWATLTITPAARHRAAIGATVPRIVCRAAENSACRPAALVASPGREIWSKVERIESETPDTTAGPTATRPIRPATSTTEPLRSVLLATWPFLRDSCLRLAVGFSVLS